MVNFSKKISNRLVKAVLIALFLLLSAPSKNDPKKFELPVVDPAMSSEVLSFLKDAKKYHVHTRIDAIGLIAYSKIPEGYVGFCYNLDDGEYAKGHRYSRNIMISEKVKQYPEILRKAVVYHELGHCALSKGHDPVNSYSLMGPAIAPEGETVASMVDFTEKAWPSLVYDFFTRFEIFPPPSKEEFLKQ